MKKIMVLLILAVIFLPCTLLAGEETSVFYQIKKEIYLNPDEFWIGISVEASGNSEEKVISALGKADTRIKKLKLYYKGGYYRVFKNCFWENKKYICKGFKGESFYALRLDSPQEQKKVFKTLDKYPRDYKYLVNFEEWRVSEKRIKEVEKNLEKAIFKEIFDKKRFLENQLNKKCYIKEIRFESGYYPFFTRSKSFSAIPEPTRNKKLFTRKARVIFVCK